MSNADDALPTPKETVIKSADIKPGDIVTVPGYYEPHPDPNHVYTERDPLIRWQAVIVQAEDGTTEHQLQRLPPERKRKNRWDDGYNHRLIVPGVH